MLSVTKEQVQAYVTQGFAGAYPELFISVSVDDEVRLLLANTRWGGAKLADLHPQHLIHFAW